LLEEIAEEGRLMPIAKITGQGLLAIACSVALLWGCLIAERVVLRAAVAERVRVLHEMEQLQRKPRPTPVVSPLPAAAHRPTITVG
jgi:hypothetical protein